MRKFNKIRKMLGGAQLSLNPATLGSFDAETSIVTQPVWSNQQLQVMDQAEETYNNLMKKMQSKAQFNKGFKDFFTGKSNPNTYIAGTKLLNTASSHMNQDVINSDKFNTFNQFSSFAGDTLGTIHPGIGMGVAAFQTIMNTVNKAGATTTDSFAVDEETRARMGGGYIGTYKKLDSAASMADQEVGLFNRKGFNQIQNDIAQGGQMQQNIQGIDYDNRLRLARAANTQMNAMNYANKLNGGIDFNNMRIGRLGFKLENLDRCRKIKTTHVVNVNTKRIEEFKPVIPESTKLFKEGGNIEKEWKPLFIYQEEVPQMKNGGETKQKKSRTIEELVEYAKQQNPRFIQRMSEPVKYLDLGNGEKGTHMMGWATDDNGNAIVYSQIQENDKGDLLDYGDSALDRALKNKNYLIMTPEEAKLFTESGKDSEGNLFGYKKGWPEFFLQEFKQGGSIKESEELVKLEETNQKNVIPEGALHKNKHNIEHTEEYTQKGIPVVDNDGEQQAEVELNEIIFTLEVTKKLEELHKIYKEGSKSDQDKAAIEAGKLLVQEILYNTIDRTGLISKCENGGKL